MVTDRSHMHAIPYQEKGFIYLWALFAVALAGTIMAGTAQVWQIKLQREKEAELLYVGEQFRNAIMSYYNSSPANSKEYPKNLDDLLLDSRAPAIKRHLRKIYRDPVTNSVEWGVVEDTTTAGSVATSNVSGRITGVYSLSVKKPIKKDLFPEHYAKFTDAVSYQDWKFIFKPSDTKKSPASNTESGKPGQPGQSTKPGTGQPGQPGQSASPFAPQSQTGTGGNTTSPLSSQPATGTQQKNPSFRFPMEGQ